MAGFEVDPELLRALARSYDGAADGITAIRLKVTEVAGALPGSRAGTAADPAEDRVRDAFRAVARRHENLSSLVRGTSGQYAGTEDQVVAGMKRLTPPKPLYGPWRPQ
ncbi:MAG TPA: type VII secretion target [Actinoplanes sp.]|nr:type VII secretion target [Actinoplanes sp.]